MGSPIHFSHEALSPRPPWVRHWWGSWIAFRSFRVSASLDRYLMHIGAQWNEVSGIPVITLKTSGFRGEQIRKIVTVFGPNTVFRVINAHFIADVIQFGTDKARIQDHDFRGLIDGAGRDFGGVEAGRSASDVFAGSSRQEYESYLKRDGYRSLDLGIPEDRSAVVIYDSTQLQGIKGTDGYQFVDPNKRRNALLGIVTFKKQIQPYESELKHFESEDGKMTYLRTRIANVSTSNDKRELRYISITVLGWLFDESVRNADAPSELSHAKSKKLKKIADAINNAFRIIDSISVLEVQLENLGNAIQKNRPYIADAEMLSPSSVIEQIHKIFLSFPDMTQKFRDRLLDLKDEAIRLDLDPRWDVRSQSAA